MSGKKVNDGASKDGVVYQRVIREVSGGSKYPVLTKTNYSEWALLMKVKLKARALWTVIEDGADPQEEMMALDALCSAVPPEMIPTIAKKETAKEAWDTIATLRVGDDRVKKSTAQQLRRKFDLAVFEDGETVEDFALRLNNMAAQLATMDEEVEEAKVVAKILRSLPPRFKQIAIAIKTLLDISTMSVADLTGRLKEAEEAFEEAPASLQHEGKLYLTEEEWDARRKKRETENHSGGGASGGRGRAGRRGGGRRGRGRARGDSSPGGQSKPTGDECRRCGKMGHWARECRSRPKQEQAHTVQDEAEASLLLAKISSISPPPKSEVQSSDGAPATSPLTDVPLSQSVSVGLGAEQRHGGSESEATTHTQIEIWEQQVFTQLGEEKNREAESWVLDTGATNHMSGSRTAFSRMDTAVLGTVRFGDDSVAQIEGRGTITFSCKNGELRSFSGVYFIPRLTTNIVSVGQLDERGYKIDIKDGVMQIREPDGRLLAMVKRAANRLYTLHVKIAETRCLAVRSRGDEVAWRWHERFGHVNMAALRKLAREELVRGLPVIGQVEELCEACQAGKQRRNPFPAQAEFRAKQCLELVHGDLCGPIAPATPRGNKYFLLLVDDLSRYMWLAVIPSKDRAAAEIKEIQARAEGESGLKLKALRTDRGGEFTAAEFAEYCAAEGVHRQHTAPYSPQQNGVVERRNGTVMATARSMLKAKGLPGWFWGEAVSTAVYVLNRCPTKSVDSMTPFEAWHGKKPAVHHLKTFGCIVYVRNTTPHLKKLEDRGRKMIFVGYERGSKAYRAYDPVTKRVHVTRDVAFDEQAQWDWGAGGDDGEPSGGDDVFTIEYATTGQATPTAVDTEEAPAHQTPGGPDNVAEQHDEFDDEILDADHDYDAPLRFRSVNDIIGPAPPRGFAQRALLAEEPLATSYDEPSSFTEAERSPSWRKAMIEEIEAIEENGTWYLTDLPPGRKAIGVKWVFKVKQDEHGAVSKHKARLVVKGYAQRHGIDYDEVFAPVARLDSVRLLIALAAHEGWEVHHMDVKSAFLNGDLQEEVYVQQPAGFIVSGKEHKVFRLRKALYGLHQAPRAWYTKLDDTLLSLGFRRSESEHAVYIRQNNDAKLVVGVYVDDLVITGTDRDDLRVFKNEMAAAFKMSDLGLLHYYLGIEVKQSASGISLSQGAYAAKILERSGMAGCNPCQTPMEARLKLSKQSTESPVDATTYRSFIGSLRYLVNTRPDLAFSVGYVSRFLEEPKEDHLAALKRILRYVAGTSNWGLWFGRKKGNQAQLTGFSDADFAGDVDARKSTTGVIFMLAESPISWQSKKQRIVAQSSCESEYIAAANATCQALWLAQVLGEMQGSKPSAPLLKVDNKSAIALIKNPVLHEQSRHIEVKYHLVRKCEEKGLIKVQFVRSEEQLSDILTKSLGRAKFQEFRSKIGMINVAEGARQGLGGD